MANLYTQGYVGNLYPQSFKSLPSQLLEGTSRLFLFLYLSTATILTI
jgi:hypothetical protein